jgi:hypothetical protein
MGILRLRSIRRVRRLRGIRRGGTARVAEGFVWVVGIG